MRSSSASKVAPAGIAAAQPAGGGLSKNAILAITIWVALSFSVVAVVLGLIPIYIDDGKLEERGASQDGPSLNPTNPTSSPPPPSLPSPPFPSSVPPPPAAPPPPLPPNVEPINCEGSYDSVLDLYQCLKPFIIREGEIQTANEWDMIEAFEADVTGGLQAAADAVLSLTVACEDEQLFDDATREDFTSASFSANGTQYCVLHERHSCPWGPSSDSRFCHGSPILITPTAQGSISRNLHLATTHPLHDLNTGEQSSLLFESTGAKSLLIAGAHRHAYQTDSSCQTSYSAFDVAHNVATLFHSVSKRIIAWQDAQTGGCDESCLFLQPHGKGSTTCPSDTVFLSAGLSAESFYTESSTRNDAINTFQSTLNASVSAWTVTTPAQSSCGLVGGTNVQGRLVNNVQEGEECDEFPATAQVTGDFVHMESAIEARDFSDQQQMEAIAAALRTAIPCACSEGMSCINGMCN